MGRNSIGLMEETISQQLQELTVSGLWYTNSSSKWLLELLSGTASVVTLVEEYNGTSWTEMEENLNTARGGTRCFTIWKCQHQL